MRQRMNSMIIPANVKGVKIIANIKTITEPNFTFLLSALLIKAEPIIINKPDRIPIATLIGGA